MLFAVMINKLLRNWHMYMKFVSHIQQIYYKSYTLGKDFALTMLHTFTIIALWYPYNWDSTVEYDS